MGRRRLLGFVVRVGARTALSARKGGITRNLRARLSALLSRLANSTLEKNPNTHIIPPMSGASEAQKQIHCGPAFALVENFSFLPNVRRSFGAHFSGLS
jgi:hypothetical protein